MKKQISIVLETKEEFEELDLISDLKKFISAFDNVKIIGTHVKVLKPMGKRGYEKDIQNHHHS